MPGRKVPNKPPQVTPVKLDQNTSAFLSELNVDVKSLTLNENSIKNVLNTLIKTIGQLKNEITYLKETGSEFSSDGEEWEVKGGEKGKKSVKKPRGGVGEEKRGWKGNGVPSNLQEQVRHNSDYIDNIHQRTMKGNILYVSPENESKNLKSIIQEPEEIGEENYTQHICDTIKEHYGVTIDPVLDIAACHPTSKGCGIIRFKNRRIGSAFAKLCSAILKGPKTAKKEGPDVETGERSAEGQGEGAQTDGAKKKESKGIRPNFWLTFQLTKRRADLIKKLKELKKDGKISHFTSNENGVINLVRNKGEAPKRLTMDYRADHSKTYYIAELLQLVS